MKDFSQYYLTYPAGPPTQGDIWMNLPCGSLAPTTNIALTITPRCDFEHDKTPVFNYLPAIAVETYVDDSLSRLLEHELLSLDNQLKRLDIPLPAYELLEIGASPESIVNELELEVARPDVSKRTMSDVQKFREIVDQGVRIRNVLTAQDRTPTLLKSLVRPREVERFREQILRNQLNDVHMLPPCVGAFEQTMAVLLRHPTSCDIRCLRLAYSCITQKDWERGIARSVTELPGLTYFGAKPERIARLKSPYLENVVARFAALFSRIGVPDLTQTEFAWLAGGS